MEEIDKEKPTFVPGVPRFFNALNESPLVKKFDLTSVRACISGAAPLPTAVAERFAEITNGAILVEGYGLTEASPVTHANPLHGVRKPGSIGLPLPDTDCKIVDLGDPDRELGLRRARRALRPGAAGDARLLEPSRGDGARDPQRVAPHRRRRDRWTTTATSGSSTG